MLRTLVVIAKEPVAGRVKTRLIGAFSPAQAAALAGAALLDTLGVLCRIPCEHRVLLFDGDAAGWSPRGWTVIAQGAGGLDERLSAGFDRLPAGPALLVGMDTPQLAPHQLRFDAQRYDSCLGLAEDGGFWVIGFRDPRRARAVIRGVPMSSAATGSAQHRRLIDAGMSVQLLDPLVDIDTPADARAVASAHPNTRFAQTWRRAVAPRSGAGVDAPRSGAGVDAPRSGARVDTAFA